MRTNIKTTALILLGVGFFIPAVLLHAEDTAGQSTTNLKQEIKLDKQQIKSQKREIFDNAQAAKAEEKNLLIQIRQAEQSGDKQTAATLRKQLKAIHQKNVAQRNEDFKNFQESKKELVADKKEAKLNLIDTNKDGKIDSVEMKAFHEKKQKFDKDNNPPGPKGGPGTNWENRPGPQGGPGASPDYKGPKGPKAAKAVKTKN